MGDRTPKAKDKAKKQMMLAKQKQQADREARRPRAWVPPEPETPEKLPS